MTIYPRCGALLCAVLVGALLLHLAPPSLATQAPPDPKALHAKGLEAFKAERFSEAGEAFMAAQALDPSASLLWNAARSFDKAGDDKRARAAYNAYVDHTDANPEKAARASKWLGQHPQRAATPVSQAQAAPDEPARATVIITRSESSGGGHTGLGWTLVGFGAAATIGGTIAMVLAQGSGAETDTLVWDQDYEETLGRHRSLSATAEQQELAAWLTYGAAVGLVSTGLFLLLRGQGDTSEVSTGFTSIEVNPNPGGLSASGTWRF